MMISDINIGAQQGRPCTEFGDPVLSLGALLESQKYTEKQQKHLIIFISH